VRADLDKWRVTWETNYQSAVDTDPAAVDEFSSIFGIADTCLGPPDDVKCRDITSTDSYMIHHISLYFYGDVWTFGGGVRNLFDEEPPFVSSTEVLAYNNTPLGYGYDLQGRTYFFNIAASFGTGE
jgi:iron complex outermembrane receptor protein